MGDLQTGEFVNHRYKVVRCLGRGAMGTVYLAEDVIKVHRLVAMKILRSENLDDPDLWSKGEYQALVRLRHPNLARVYDFGRLQGSKDFFIVSEFVRGQDLLTATRNIQFEEILDIIAQISRALEYIHTQGYVHFDIKPDNILITREKAIGEDSGSKVMWNADAQLGTTSGAQGPVRVKLIDFGLAEKITGTFSFAIKGTFNYVAPEIIRGQTPDKRADLYSLGVTLFQIITGRLPFVTEDGKSVAREGNAWRERLRRILDDQPGYLTEILVRLLEDDPDSRYPNAREIIQALNAGAGRCYQIETAETQASYLYCSRLIGRRKELNLLKNEAELVFRGAAAELVDPESMTDEAGGDSTVVSQLLAQDMNRRAPLLQIVGEIGVGKSRLLEEFIHFLRMRETPIYIGNCYETSKDAYQPIVEIITEMAMALGRESAVYQKYATQLKKLCPKLQSSGDEGESVGEFHEDKDRLYFVDRLVHFIIECAKEHPHVIAVNNMHWADQSTVELLGALVTEMAKVHQEQPKGLPLMLVTTMRLDEQLPEELRALLGKLAEERLMKEIHVRRFTRTQVAELIHHMLQIEEIPATFLDRLEERTSGNPLFIVETLKGLQEEGIICREGNAWRIRGGDDLARVEIPHGLEAILLRRVRMLDQSQQRVLEALAVHDKPMANKLMERFPEFAGGKVQTPLRELENRGMVERQMDGVRLLFAISQPKLREIVYNYVPQDRCKSLHGMMADALAAEYAGNTDEIIEELAYHYQRSDRVGKALELTVRAGDKSRSIYAHDRALQHYRQVILQTEGDPKNRKIWIDTHEKIGDICQINGNYDVAQVSYDTLLHVDESEEFTVVDRCRLLRKRGRLDEIQGEYDRALRNYQEAKSVIDALPESPTGAEEKIKVYNAIGSIYVSMGRYDRAMKVSIEALRMAKEDSEKSENAMIFSTIGSANYYKGNLDQALEYHKRALEIREHLEDAPEMIICYNNLGASYLENGEYLEAIQHFEQGLRMAAEIGDPFGRALSLHYLGDTYSIIGNWGKAEQCLEESLQLSRTYRVRYLNNQTHMARGRLRKQQGEYTKAEGDLFRAMGIFAKQGNRWGLTRCLYELAEIHDAKQDFEEALKQVREGISNASALKIGALEARGSILETRLLRRSGQPPGPESLEKIERIAKQLDGCRNSELLGELELERAEVLLALGQKAEAAKALQKGEELYREGADRLPPDLRQSFLSRHQVRRRPEEENRFKEVNDDGVVREETQNIQTPVKNLAKPGAQKTPAGAVSGAEELMRLASLLQEAGQGVSPRVFVDKVLTCLVQAAGADELFFLLRNGDDVRVLSAMNKRGEKLRNAASRICLAALQKVVDSGEAVVAMQVLDDPALQSFEFLFTNNIAGLAILPIRIDGVVRGAVYLNNPRADHIIPPAGGMILSSYSNLLTLILPRLGATQPA